ncbi:MAG TPA: ribulose-phosphate 3-epimerase [Clostridiaceae bacterium]|nr:ribulose-phosphate 3-epimerase [Clostridiaceae bacterium]
MRSFTYRRGETVICPSLLSADFSKLDQSIGQIKADTPILHLDIMDGHFVPNISFGPGIVSIVRTLTDQLLDVHLMVSDPARWIEPFYKAGADFLVIHLEATPHAERLLTDIRERGMRAGIALTPQTPVSMLDYLMDKLDLILLMTVNPGFGGQSYLPAMTEKIRVLRDRIDDSGRSILLQVDGGIDVRTAPIAAQAGADLLVAGSAVFGEDDPAAALEQLKMAARLGQDVTP